MGDRFKASNMMFDSLNQVAKNFKEFHTINDLCQSFAYVLKDVFGDQHRISLIDIHREPPRVSSWDGGFNSQLWGAIYDMFNSNGLVFKVIERIMSDAPHVKFHVNLTDLPITLSDNICNGLCSDLLKSRFNHVAGSLSLSPIEYFFLMFGSHLLFASDKLSCYFANWEVGEPIYCTLVEDYCHVFLPSEGSSTPLSLHYSASFSMLDSFSSLGMGASEPLRSGIPRTPLNLFKRGQLAGNRSMQAVKKDDNFANDVIWRAQTFIQFITDAWFCLPTLSPTGMSDDYFGYGTSARHPPHPIRVMFVRQFLKHLHRFCYDGIVTDSLTAHQHARSNPRPGVAKLEPFGSVAGSQSPSSLGRLGSEFKSIIVPRLLQRPLYSFFLYCLNRWPFDASFRCVLEAWMTFVQPWRYATQRHGNFQSASDVWSNFFAKNWLFVKTLMPLFVNRFLRMDFTASRNATMLVRFAKVMHYPHFMHLLQSVDGELQLASQTGKFSASPDMTAAYNHIVSLESSVYGHQRQGNVVPGVSYGQLDVSATYSHGHRQGGRHGHRSVEWDSVFTPGLVQKLMELVRLVKVGQKQLERQLYRLGASPRRGFTERWVTWVVGFFVSENARDAQIAELHRTYEQLESAELQLTEAFNLPAVHITASQQDLLNSSLGSSSYISDGGGLTSGSDSEFVPDHLDDRLDGHSKLTHLGQFQVAHNLKKFDYSASQAIAPDLLPPRSDEIGCLVTLWAVLAGFCSSMIGYAKLNQLCHDSSGILGRLARATVLLPPTRSASSGRPKISRSPTSGLPARLTFRRMASLQLVVGAVFLLVLCLLLSWKVLYIPGVWLTGRIVHSAFIAS